MKQKTIIIAIVVAFMAILLPSCGGRSDSGSGSASTSSSSSSLSQYAGKWELFQVGASPSESATFTLKISSNGNASISHYARTGYTDTCLESGDGYAELNGDVLFVEITSGKSKGTTLRLVARGGRIYTPDGEAFTKK